MGLTTAKPFFTCRARGKIVFAHSAGWVTTFWVVGSPPGQLKMRKSAAEGRGKLGYHAKTRPWLQIFKNLENHTAFLPFFDPKCPTNDKASRQSEESAEQFSRGVDVENNQLPPPGC
jgi:hypothetical protein